MNIGGQVKFKTQLDVVTEGGDVDFACASLIGGRPVTYRVVDENGPAGGWPIVEFVGSYEDLRAIHLAYANGHAEDAAMFDAGLVEVDLERKAKREWDAIDRIEEAGGFEEAWGDE